MVWSREAAELETAFKLCKPIDTENEYEVASLNANLVQLIQNKLQTQSYDEVKSSCEALTSDEGDNDFRKFSKWIRNDLFPAIYCFNFNTQDLVNNYRQIKWGSIGTIGGDRQQLYLR